MPLQDEPRLRSLGWDTWFESRFWPHHDEGLVPARVSADFGADYEVRDGIDVVRAVTSSRLRDGDGQPAVGDWVALLYRGGTSLIQAVLERRTTFARKTASVETRQQVLAANVDVAFVVASAQDVNARRVERYLTMAWQSGASPVVVLTKADVSPVVDELRFELEAVAAGSPLLGRDVMRTRTVHRSGEGRHMTSHRQLVELPQAGVVIDTPGLREAQLWAGEDALGSTFEDVEELARQCRFPDCAHETEPGCAVKEAIVEGALDAGRLTSYRKLQRELRAVAAKSDARLRADERRKWKQISVANRARDRYLR